MPKPLDDNAECTVAKFLKDLDLVPLKLNHILVGRKVYFWLWSRFIKYSVSTTKWGRGCFCGGLTAISTMTRVCHTLPKSCGMAYVSGSSSVTVVLAANPYASESFPTEDASVFVGDSFLGELFLGELSFDCDEDGALDCAAEATFFSGEDDEEAALSLRSGLTLEGSS